MLWIGLVLSACGLIAGAAETDPAPVETALVVSTGSLSPGKAVKVGVLFTIPRHWHLYWSNPGESGMPPQVDWQVPAGWRVEGPEWPVPKAFDGGGVVAYGYEDQLLLAYTLAPAAETAVGSAVRLGAEVTWLACKDVCVPGMASLTVRLPVSLDAPRPGPHSEIFDRVAQDYPVTAHDWNVRAQRRNGAIILYMTPGTSPALGATDRIRFFPFEQGLITTHTELRTAGNGQIAVATMRADTDRHRSITELAGIVSIHSNAGASRSHGLIVTAPINADKNPGQRLLPTDKGGE